MNDKELDMVPEQVYGEMRDSADPSAAISCAPPLIVISASITP